jgi:hypothetical protein
MEGDVAEWPDDFSKYLVDRIRSPQDFGPLVKPSWLESDVQRFGVVVRLYGRAQRPMPCFIEPEEPPWPLDPLAFAQFFEVPLSIEPEPIFEFHVAYRGSFEAMAGRAGLELSELPNDSVLAALEARLSKFLQPMAAAGMAAPSAGTTVRYLPFEVHTATSGLRVHMTPMYKMTPRVFGGTLSTPVKGSILPGTWRFGVDGPVPLTWDTANFGVPPLTRATLPF